MIEEFSKLKIQEIWTLRFASCLRYNLLIMFQSIFHRGGRWNFKQGFQSAFKVIKLDAQAMTGVSKDSRATRMAALFIVISSFLGGMGSMLFPSYVYRGLVVYRPTLFQVFEQTLAASLMLILAIFLVHFVAVQLFKARGSFEEFFRVAGYAYVVGILNIYPPLTLVVGLWTLVVLWKALTVVKRMAREKAVLTLVAVLFIFCAFYFFLFTSILSTNLFGGLYFTPY